MKKWIHSATDAFDQAIEDDEYYSTTPRNEVEFDHDVIWSVELYDEPTNMIYSKEVFILARTYKEARDKAVALASEWGYPTQPDVCVVQYAYVSPARWASFKKDTVGGVEYGI